MSQSCDRALLTGMTYLTIQLLQLDISTVIIEATVPIKANSSVLETFVALCFYRFCFFGLINILMVVCSPLQALQPYSCR